MRLGKLLEGENFQITHPHMLDQEINHWTERSDEVKENSWFIAVRGESSDGHNFIQDAISRGASGLIVEEFFSGKNLKIPQVIVSDSRRLLSIISSHWFDQPSKKLHLIGVTGTNGKTTTTYLIQHLLNRFTQTGLVGTIEAGWKNQHVLTRNTTPGIKELNSILNQMVSDGVTACAMEVSSHALKQNRVNEVCFKTAVFTNLTQDHLDYHKTFDDYFQSKSRLFLDFMSVSRRVINLDDPYGKKLWNLVIPDSRISYAINSEADYRAIDINMSLVGTQFILEIRKKRFNVSTKLLCLHNIYNLLASIAVVREMGYPVEEIIQSVSEFEGVCGRLERFQLPNGATVFVDYAHSPDAFHNIYASLKLLKRGKLISVFGCGGNRDRQKRPMMGRIARENSDWVIITSDNPRQEHPKEIIAEILTDIENRNALESVNIIEDRKIAIREALDRAKKDDIVLILGKGHEDYQIIGKEKRKFSDQEEIKEWVRLHTTSHPSKSLLGV